MPSEYRIVEGACYEALTPGTVVVFAQRGFPTTWTKSMQQMHVLKKTTLIMIIGLLVGNALLPDDDVKLFVVLAAWHTWSHTIGFLMHIPFSNFL